MSIAFDVDNVLADTISAWCNLLHEIKGIVIEKANIKSHKIVGSVRLSPQIIFSTLDRVWENWKQLPMTENDIPEYIEQIKKKGYNIFIVTNRPLRSKKYVESWIANNGIVYDQLYFLGPYSSKVDIKVDYLVDDAPEHLEEFIKTGRIGFLYNQPWNARFTMKNSIRVNTISEVIFYLE